jgi:hypothetical protein
VALSFSGVSIGFSLSLVHSSDKNSHFPAKEHIFHNSFKSFLEKGLSL